MKQMLLVVSLFISVSVLAVPFSLRNFTDQSISLIIPGVMKPNLSPNSKSAVDLKVGQKIYFKYNNRKTLLLTVTEDLKNMDIDVAELIEQRRREIDAGLHRKF